MSQRSDKWLREWREKRRAAQKGRNKGLSGQPSFEDLGGKQSELGIEGNPAAERIVPIKPELENRVAAMVSAPNAPDDISEARFYESAKTIGLGVVVIIVGYWFWHHEIGNPLNELALIRRARIATGFLAETYDYERESQSRMDVLDVGIYTYQLPDGREFKTTAEVATGQLNEQVEVEYLPDNPTVSRVKGDGCDSVTEWLWRKVGIGSLFLALCSSPGIILVRKGVRDLRDLRRIGKDIAL